jgi:glyoxylase-like metal-dependent hydrolase (beta-lactamase superfamily II)
MSNTTDRRPLVLAALALAAGSALVAQQAPPQPGPPPTLVKVRDDMYIVQNQANNGADLGYYGGNATIVVTNDGVVLIDSKSDREHDDLIAKVKSLSDKPIKYVILTHNHGDHTGGAAKLKAMGVPLIISTADRDNMARGGATPIADFSFSGDAQLTVGGKRAELYQFRGHTRGDTVVYFPAEKVIILGDLLTTAETIPMIVNYPDGGSWNEWALSMDKIVKMDFDTVVPGHGPQVTKAQFLELRSKMLAIMDRVRGLVKEKKSQEEIQQILIKEFNWGTGGSAANIAGMMVELR